MPDVSVLSRCSIYSILGRRLYNHARLCCIVAPIEEHLIFLFAAALSANAYISERVFILGSAHGGCEIASRTCPRASLDFIKCEGKREREREKLHAQN